MFTTAVFDTELMRRHDRHGPRYTSYPTAVQFHSSFDTSAYRRAALLSNEHPAKPLSVYVHVPFCSSPCFYCGCNKVITRDPQQAVDYLRHLVKEIELQSTLFNRHRCIKQLHLGGGTPTFFSIGQIGQVIDALSQYFYFDDREPREFSIEVDPRTVTPSTFKELAALGFNRTSLGVQDFDPQVQDAVNRRQSTAQVEQCVRQAREAGFASTSFDLIYGLPLQTLASFERTLDTVIEMRPDRIAVYGYAHMPRMFRAQRALDAAQLPGVELRLQLLALSVRKLTAAGYVHIGMDHFALPHDELCGALRDGSLQRNFQGYSTHADCDIIGLGVSAIGSVGNAYAQNRKDLASYYQTLDRGQLTIERGVALSVDDLVRRDVIQRIMCTNAVAYRDIEERYALDFYGYFAGELQQLQPLAQDGLVNCDAEGITVSERGRYLLRSIAMVFDSYLKPQAQTSYSKVI